MAAISRYSDGLQSREASQRPQKKRRCDDLNKKAEACCERVIPKMKDGWLNLDEGRIKAEYLSLVLKKIDESVGVTGLILGSAQLRGECLTTIKTAQVGLRALRFACSKVTKKQLIPWEDSLLEELNLSQCEISKSGFAQLKELKFLQTLNLSECGLSDEDLLHLEPLILLETLDLSGNEELSGEGLRHLKECDSLRKLNLSGCEEVSGESLGQLEGCDIQELNLSGCKITDWGLGELQGFPHLRKLHLSGCEITDEGLRYLMRLKQLEELYLSDCKKVTAKGVALFQKFPQLTIHARGSGVDPEDPVCRLVKMEI